MLILYDKNHNKEKSLTAYSDLHITQELSRKKIILDQLHFKYPRDTDNGIDYEKYVRTESAEFVVKEINLQTSSNGATYAEYVCDQNVEPLKGILVADFEPTRIKCKQAAQMVLQDTGWGVVCHVDKYRSPAKQTATVLECLEEICSIYDAEIKFDTIHRVVYIYENVGKDVGSYFIDQLNLKELQIQGNSRDYATRLYPYGKGGLSVRELNNGKDYIDNFQYSDKVVAAYWIDNRYTNRADLLEDAKARLEYLSAPQRSYSATIVDLANISPTWASLGFELGDTVTLVSQPTSTRTKQRIVKIDRYFDEPERTTVELSNKIASLDDIILRVSDAAEVVEQATDSLRNIQGSRVAVHNADGTDSYLPDIKATADSSISYMEDWYYQSTSYTVLSGGEWSKDCPAWVDNTYIWSKRITVLNDGTESETDPVCLRNTGDNGQPGAPGADGQTSYLHIAYATSADGTQGFDVSVSGGKTYIGQYTDFVEQDSTDPSAYKWSKIQGAKGEDAVTLRIESSRGTVFKKNSKESTTLLAVIYKGDERITDADTMHAVIGESAYLEWSCKKMGDNYFSLLSNDARITENGFELSLYPSDVDAKAVFKCDLII